jgi:hypothetical protein
VVNRKHNANKKKKNNKTKKDKNKKYPGLGAVFDKHI